MWRLLLPWLAHGGAWPEDTPRSGCDFEVLDASRDPGWARAALAARAPVLVAQVPELLGAAGGLPDVPELTSLYFGLPPAAVAAFGTEPFGPAFAQKILELAFSRSLASTLEGGALALVPLHGDAGRQLAAAYPFERLGAAFDGFELPIFSLGGERTGLPFHNHGVAYLRLQNKKTTLSVS